MTRITSFGRKRAYIDSTSGCEEITNSVPPQAALEAAEGDPHGIDDAPNLKKKRKKLQSVETRAAAAGTSKSESLATRAPAITNDDHKDHGNEVREPPSNRQPAVVTPAESEKNKTKRQQGAVVPLLWIDRYFSCHDRDSFPTHAHAQVHFMVPKRQKLGAKSA
jgi:hypothetical protein